MVLHGYTQNGHFFERKTLRLQRHLQNAFPGTTFVFPTAPIKLKPWELTDGRHDGPLERDENLENMQNSLREPKAVHDVDACAWFKLHNTQEPVFGLTQSLDLLAGVLREEGPFDGMIGFSQGSALVGLVASLLEGPARKEAFDRHLRHFPESMSYPEAFKTLVHP